MASVNLLDVWGNVSTPGATKPLEVVRFSSRETPVIAFTSTTDMVTVHFNDELETRGYVHCNGPDCVLCKLGRKKEERALLPVYLPIERAIGVISISASSRPGSLRPQLLPLLGSGKSLVVFIKKADQMTFTVGSKEVDLKDYGCDGLIQEFQRKLDANEVDLASVYPRMTNDEIARIPGINTMLQLKGVKLGAGDRG